MISTKPMTQRSTPIPLIVAAAFAILGIILLIVGIVLVVRSGSKVENCSAKKDGRYSTPTASPSQGNRCEYSAEAKRAGLGAFLAKVSSAYYETHPERIMFKYGTTKAEIRKVYKPYDPSPRNLKMITDKAMELYYEIGNKSISEANLKPREKKALHQVKHYLKHNFATPYDGNYYAGDFLMGPNLFCWQPICSMGSEITSLRYFKPLNGADLELLREKMAEIKQTFHQYIDNLRYGVRAGMVRSTEECKAGFNSLKRKFLSVAANGPEGIFEEDNMQFLLASTFISTLLNNTEEVARWENKYKMSVNESLRQFVLEYIGKPIDAVNKYLETEHAEHCVPSNISSGLANLPLPFVYVNGTSTGNATTRVLPTGELLNGKKSYEMIMPYFTTTNITPEEVHQLGYTMLRKLYPEVLEIARSVTEQADNDTAKVEFIRRLNESEHFFVEDGEIPANESDTNAHNLCSTFEKARKYCPHRWAAMERWFDEARRAMSMLDPKTTDMFYFNGYKHTAPNCPVEMRPDLNPSSGAQSYMRSTPYCSRPSYYNIPFFLERPGPKFEEWSVNAHEARPGHHTQVQGLVEHFLDSCGGVIYWLDRSTSYTAFSEGWGLYAENPLIARDTDTYDNAPYQKYGMLKWQIWRALRLIVDTGLHYKGFTRGKALDFFATYAWDTSDGAQKEVTRYQSDPGQATAYMIGQLHIIKLRKYAEDKLGKDFDLRDFHFYLLSQGSAPLSYIEDVIHEYVRCALSKGSGEGCTYVLNPVAPPGSEKTQVVGVVDDDEYLYDPPEMPRPADYI